MSGQSADFIYLLRVRYAECDSQDVVFNARYGDYVDIALTEFFRFKLGGYQNLLAQGLDSQIVRQTTQWQSSARFDDVIACHVRVIGFGNTSYVVETDMRDHFSARRFATTESVYVMVARSNFEKTAVPAHIRAQLVTTDTVRVVDHAGVTLG
jgi:acyl-CoA thioester hydrolase